MADSSKLLLPGDDTEEDSVAMDEEKEDVRKAALEFMISLSEAKPGMVRKVDGWAAAIVRGCLEGMGELGDDDLDVWLEADVRPPLIFCVVPCELTTTGYHTQPAEDPTDDSYPRVYEQSIDRLACALGGKAVLPPAFQYIPSMLASYDWRLRHAGLMAIAAIGEGTSKVTLFFLAGCLWLRARTGSDVLVVGYAE